ncbi:MAG: GNAT family N-acetyltransferase, partial [Candidatus Omnitrophica bacterium]|nr:GNAT family N-acetyltransferase [Candidatus Omnitrophota bacterium]
SLDWFLNERTARDAIINKVVSGEIDLSKYQALAWDMEGYADMLEAIDKYARANDGSPFRYRIKNAYNRETGLRDLEVMVEVEPSSVMVVDGVGSVDEVTRKYFDSAVLVDQNDEEAFVRASMEREARKPADRQLTEDTLRSRLEAVDIPRAPYFRHFAIRLHDLYLDNSNHASPSLYTTNGATPGSDGLASAAVKPGDGKSEQAPLFPEPEAPGKKISRRWFTGLGLVVSALAAAQTVFGGQQTNPIEADVANQAATDKKMEKELTGLFDAFKGARDTGLLDSELLRPEINWDRYSLQKEVVKRGLSSGRRFEFADGSLYHGTPDLDSILLADKARGEFFFTRTPHEWAIGPFTKTSKNPAIFVLKTDYFNSLVKSGDAELKYFVYTNHEENPYSPQSDTRLDPYPKARSFSIDGVEEIWVSEEVFERYQRIASAADRSELPSEDQPLMAVQKKLRKLLATGKIKMVPGLRHTDRPCGTKAERINSFAAANRAVGKYMKDRGLFAHIPFFRIEGEKDPFRDINKNAFASIALLSRRQLMDDMHRISAEIERTDKWREIAWMALCVVVPILPIIWLLVRLGIAKKPGTATVSPGANSAITRSAVLDSVQEPQFEPPAQGGMSDIATRDCLIREANDGSREALESLVMQVTKLTFPGFRSRDISDISSQLTDPGMREEFLRATKASVPQSVTTEDTFASASATLPRGLAVDTKIELATPGDAGEMADLYLSDDLPDRQSYSPEHDIIPNSAVVRDFLTSLIGDPYHKIYVARKNGKIIGYVKAVYNQGSRRGTIDLLVVKREYRNPSIAFELERAAIDWLMSNSNIQTIEAGDDSSYGQSGMILERFGFKNTGGSKYVLTIIANSAIPESATEALRSPAGASESKGEVGPAALRSETISVGLEPAPQPVTMTDTVTVRLHSPAVIAEQVNALVGETKAGPGASKPFRIRVFYQAMFDEYHFESSEFGKGLLFEPAQPIDIGAIERYLTEAIEGKTVMDHNMHISRFDYSRNTIEVYLIIPLAEYREKVMWRPLKQQPVLYCDEAFASKLPKPSTMTADTLVTLPTMTNTLVVEPYKTPGDAGWQPAATAVTAITAASAAASLATEGRPAGIVEMINGIFKDVNVRSGATVLLSESPFIENGDRTELEQEIMIALKPLLDSGAIAILSLEEIERRVRRSPSKDKLAVILSKEDYASNKAPWEGDDKTTPAKASVLILDDKLTGANYLYLQGVIGLARAIMSGNRQAIAYYYKILSGVDIGDTLNYLDNAEWNTIAFALRAILRFKGLGRMDPGELKANRAYMEKLLIAA